MFVLFIDIMNKLTQNISLLCTHSQSLSNPSFPVAFIWSNIPLGSAPGLDSLKVFLVSSGALPAQFKGNCGSLSSGFISYTVPTHNSRNKGKKEGKEGQREGKEKGRKKENFQILPFFLILFTIPKSQMS